MHLFSRNVQVRIESVDGQAKMFKSEDGFTIEFECGFGTLATSKVKLWNVLNSTVEMCNSKNNKRAKLELYAGYEEGIYLLTSAYILSHDVKKSGANRVLEIQAGALVDLLTNIWISETFEYLSLNVILKQIFTKNGILNYSINLENDSFVYSISFNNTLQNVLNEICRKAKAVWYVKNGKIYVESKGVKAKRESEIYYLSYETGLVDYPETNGLNIKLKTLLNPNLNYGSIIRLKHKDTLSEDWKESDYQVFNGRHIGGSKTNHYYTELECKKL